MKIFIFRMHKHHLMRSNYALLAKTWIHSLKSERMCLIWCYPVKQNILCPTFQQWDSPRIEKRFSSFHFLHYAQLSVIHAIRILRNSNNEAPSQLSLRTMVETIRRHEVYGWLLCQLLLRLCVLPAIKPFQANTLMHFSSCSIKFMRRILFDIMSFCHVTAVEIWNLCFVRFLLHSVLWKIQLFNFIVRVESAHSNFNGLGNRKQLLRIRFILPALISKAN